MSKEKYREYLLGATIVAVEVDPNSNRPTFRLDNGAEFQMTASVSGADYDEYARFTIEKEKFNQHSGGYVGFEETSESVSLHERVKSTGDALVEDLCGTEAFQQFVGSQITRVSLTMGVSIDVDNQKRISSGCYDYLKHNRYYYTVYSLVD